MPKAKLKVTPTLPDSRPLPGTNAGPAKPLPRNQQSAGLPPTNQRLRKTTGSIPKS